MKETHIDRQKIEESLAYLGVHLDDNATTDPEIMKKIMHEIDFDVKEISNYDSSGLLLRMIAEKIPLLPLKERIIQGIIHNPPIANTLIETADKLGSQNKKINPLNVDRQVQFQYSLYFTVIFEVLTQLMLNDIDLETKIIKSLLKNRKVKNPGSSIENFISRFKIMKGSFLSRIFPAIKQISLDSPMFMHMCWRLHTPKPTADQIDSFISEYTLTGLNRKYLKNFLKKPKGNIGGLSANIFEALIEEMKINPSCKPSNNIEAGLALILYLEMFDIMPSRKYVLSHNQPTTSINQNTINEFWDHLYKHSRAENYVAQVQGLPIEWVNLYEAWNMEFLFNYFSTVFHLTLPNLLIPNAMSSKPEFYLAARLVSVWLTSNFIFSMMRNNVKIDYPPIDTHTFLEIFGKNNLIYAQNNLLKLDKELDIIYKYKLENKSRLSLYLKVLKAMNGNYIFPRKFLAILKKKYYQTEE